MAEGVIDKWIAFFTHEKLKVLDSFDLVKLVKDLAEKGTPKYRPYKSRLETRRLIVNRAMDLGIDLSKHRMGRGLLDMWNEVYKERFGSTFGTVAEREVKRREIKRRLARERQDNSAG